MSGMKFEKTVKSFGDGGHVILPKMLIGKNVVITITNKQKLDTLEPGERKLVEYWWKNISMKERLNLMRLHETIKNGGD